MQTERAGHFARQERAFDVAVVGGGIVGRLAACALSTTPHRVVHVAPPAPERDGRTTALLDDAVRDLEALGAWDACEPHAAPLRTMRLIDGTRRLLRARPLDFRAHEVGLDAFGYNVPNERLVTALGNAMERGGVTRLSSTVEHVDPTGGALTLADGDRITADLLVAADGRGSRLREAAGIGVRRWDYGQVALVLPFRHTLPHHDVSTEIHTETGPFTQVPLPPREGAPFRSSLVWVVRPPEVPALVDAPHEALVRTIDERFQGGYGEVIIEEPPATFPLIGQIAHAAGRGRTALVGEAAHVFPPIGAQGANLGFRDVRDLVAHVRARSLDAVADAYSRTRMSDVAMRTAGVDVLNRSLLTDLLPVQAGRFVATEMMARFGGLRRAVMRAGLAPSSDRLAPDRPAPDGPPQPGNGSTGSAPVVMT